MESTWLKDRTWTPFLKDGTLPTRFRDMPWVAINRIRHVPGRSLQYAYDLWSWFSAPLKLRDQSSPPEGGPRERAEKAVASLKQAANDARREGGQDATRSGVLEAKRLLEQECYVTEEMLDRRVTR
jgi:hypothetical protein